MLKQRYLTNEVLKDLEEKMVFIGGPRQVGKTTLAKDIIGKKFDKITYLNWDFVEDRKKTVKFRFVPDTQLIIFDEIHKYKQWKNYLKGLYDKRKGEFKLLVTGSARLNIYRKGGDSLLGRNYYYRLHPFSLAELQNLKNNFQTSGKIEIPEINRSQADFFDILYRFGGFPEPLIKQNDRYLRRWHHMRVERITDEDIRDIETIRDLSAIQILVDNLQDKVSSLLSINSLTEDLSVTHKTVKRWLDILENFYYHFRIYPYTKSKVKSLKKMAKIYLWDWSQIENNEGAKFENMIASHLLKFCHFLIDTEGLRASLYYLRDIEKREVDFLVAINEKPWFLVEVKRSSKSISKHLKYFKEQMEIPLLFQVVMENGVDFMENGIRVISASQFLSAFV